MDCAFTQNERFKYTKKSHEMDISKATQDKTTSSYMEVKNHERAHRNDIEMSKGKGEESN